MQKNIEDIKLATFTQPILYSYYRSSCSWRVRAALAYKGIEYQYVPVDLLKGEQLSEQFEKINPLKQVPVLIINGNILTHSIPIIEYLEDIKPAPPLLPSDPAKRAKVRALVETVVSAIQPIQNIKVLKYVGDEKKLDWARHWIEEGFTALEKQLEPVHGRFCFGDDLSLADICLVPQVYNAQRYEADLEKFPIIKKLNSELLKMFVFSESHPSKQLDCPEGIV